MKRGALIGTALLALAVFACSKKDENKPNETNITSAPVDDNNGNAGRSIDTSNPNTSSTPAAAGDTSSPSTSRSYNSGSTDTSSSSTSSSDTTNIDQPMNMEKKDGGHVMTPSKSRDPNNHSTTLGDGKSGQYTGGKGTYGGKDTQGTGGK